MEPRLLNVNERNETGTEAVRRMRRKGDVPAVVYAEGHAAKHISLNAHEYELAVRGVRATQIFKFKSESSKLDGTMTLIKAVQMEPIKGQVLHVDFISISAGHRLTVTVPVELTGESAAIKENRAFLNQTIYEIDVECLPDQIPSGLKLDITPLKEGGSLHAGDVQLPAGVKLRSLPKLTIVSAISKKAMEAQEAAFEAAAKAAQAGGAGAAAAAAPAAEGAAPAAGAAAAAPAKEEKKGK